MEKHYSTGVGGPGQGWAGSTWLAKQRQKIYVDGPFGLVLRLDPLRGFEFLTVRATTQW